jgi:mono/diheme cytochrome c family protein
MTRTSRLIGVAFVAWLTFVILPSHPEELSAQPPAKSTDDKVFEEKLIPFLNTYCNKCHNSDKNAGGISLDTYKTLAAAKKDRKAWEMVQRVLANEEMPPKKAKEQPQKAELLYFADYIENHVSKVDCGLNKNAGRVTIRRLNRSEYNNTIRDLCSVDFKPADDFPSDDVGYGFDNIGDVLSVQPILLEKYLRAADKVLEQAITVQERLPSSKQTYRPQNIRVVPADAKIRESTRNRIIFTTAGEAFLEKFNFPSTGEYTLRVRGWGTTVNGQTPEISFRVNGKEVTKFKITGTAEKPTTVEYKARLEMGERRISVHYLNPSEDKTRQFSLETIEIEGPIGGAAKPISESTKRVLGDLPQTPGENATSARKSLADFARRAFRRPVKAEEIDRLMNLFTLATTNGDAYEKAIQLPLKAILCSPHFLFRVEADPKEPETVRIVNEFELATRLSYFIWSSMPDEELFKLAEQGQLRKAGVLKSQVTRMLADAKANALTENFAGQWLQLRNLRSLSPDTAQFKGWDEGLRTAMIKESELFFEHIVKNDKSVLDFLDADYTFVNDRLSWHYGIPNVKGNEFRQVKQPYGRRGGVTSQASVLTVTSNPTRTSPVKRGKWIYENILGLQPPPPAPDVPELPPVGQLKGTLRQQMEQHRANPNCSTCHAKLDPLGFGLENFDAIGAWRELDNKQKIDSSGELPDGSKFNGPAELRKILLGKSEQFRRCLADKLLTFALGRGLDYYDKCAIDNIVTQLKVDNDRFSALVLAIVQSDPFQKRQLVRSE